VSAIFQYNQERLFREDPDLHLLYWGKEDCIPGHAVGPLIRDHYKVHFIHKGKGIVKIGQQVHTVTSGQAFFTYPQIITYYESDQAEPWSYSWVGFRGAQVDSILKRTLLAPEQPVLSMDWRVMPVLYEQLTEANQHEHTRDLQLKAIMYDFLTALVDSIPSTRSAQSSPTKQDAYVVQCMEFLHMHYCEHITVTQLAALLGLDRKYLSALFKDAVGMPPQQYLLQYRVQKACELLETSGCTIGEIARSVGYQDSLLFSKMFKKVKGVSPKQFRMQLKHQTSFHKHLPY
jgi:AraC-like DNA-binding protein